MNFLKDPRTNWKFIIIVVLLAFLVGGSVLVYQNLVAPEEKIPLLSKPKQVDWRIVEKKWKIFAEQHLEKMRQLDPEQRKFVEIKSPFISKYLPNYKIYTEKYFTFALRADGEIIQIAKPALDWSARGDESYYRSPQYSNFISKQHIQVVDEKIAIEVIKLTGDIYERSYIGEPVSWKPVVFRKNDIWIVQIEYVGPPEYSIIVPPVWEIVVDEQNYIKEIRHQRERL